MGWKKKLRRAARRVKKVARRATAAVVTGGTTEVLRAVGQTGIAKGITAAVAPGSIQDVVDTSAYLAPIAGTAIGGPVGGFVGAQYAQQILAGPSEGQNMGLNNLLGGLQGVLGTIGQIGAGTPYGAVGQVGSAFLSGYMPAQGPMRQPMIQYPQPTMTMTSREGAGKAVSAVVANVEGVLMKIGAAIGSIPSVRRAMSIVRRLFNLLGTSEAVAIALGLSVAELGILATASAAKPRRRMNPGNVKALRRAHRRLESFHRLCGKNDQLRTRRRSPRRAPVIINTKGRVCD